MSRPAARESVAGAEEKAVERLGARWMVGVGDGRGLSGALSPDRVMRR